MTQALGMIEVIGYPPAVEAADAALKAAQVKLLGISKVGSGIVTVQLMGDVGAIHAAVDAGALSASRIGNVRTQHVIARTEQSVLEKIILPKPLEKEEALLPIQPAIQSQSNSTLTAAKEISTILTEAPVDSHETLAFSQSTEELHKLNTSQLKEVLIQKGMNPSSKKLKSAKKPDLIQLIQEQKITKEGED